MEEKYLTQEEELEIESLTEDDVDLDVDAGQRKIIWQAKDFSIREFLTMKNDGELVLQPLDQRNFVATDLIASKLIESILLDNILTSAPNFLLKHQLGMIQLQ